MKHQQHQQQMAYMSPSYAHQERLPAFCINGEFLGRDIRFNLVNQLEDVPEIRTCYVYVFVLIQVSSVSRYSYKNKIKTYPHHTSTFFIQFQAVDVFRAPVFGHLVYLYTVSSVCCCARSSFFGGQRRLGLRTEEGSAEEGSASALFCFFFPFPILFFPFPILNINFCVCV